MSTAIDLTSLEGAEAVLMDDCATKLCTVPFPVEAARAPVVMHYEEPANSATLVFLCNAMIHKNRIKPPTSLRLKGVPTRKYAVVPCGGYSQDEVDTVVNRYTSAGYCAYSATVNGSVKLYISWDERCLSAPLPPAEETE